MKDIYRELLRRSVEDAAAVAQDINESDKEVAVGTDFVAPAALNLYQHRVQQWRKDWAEAEAAQMDPGTPGMGRQ